MPHPERLLVEREGALFIRPAGFTPRLTDDYTLIHCLGINSYL